MAAVTNLGFVKVGNFKCRTCSEGQIPCQISCRSVKPLLRYRDFGIFQDGDRWNLVFLKFQICNGRNGQEDRTASPWYISSKSLKQRPRYGEFSINSKWIFEITIFNGETRHEYQIASPCQISWRSVKPLPMISRFFDFKMAAFLTIGTIKKVDVRHCAKFRRNQSKWGLDMSIFQYFKMAAAEVLEFWNIKFLMVGMVN